MLDSTNKRILIMLADDPYITQTEIAKRLNLSQSAIATRLEKMRKDAIIETFVGIDFEKVGLLLGRVDLAAEAPASIFDRMKQCPLLLNVWYGTGERNICMLLAAEDLQTLTEIVDHHIRKLPSVSNVQLSLLVGKARKAFLPLRLDVAKAPRPPCGDDHYCAKCPARENIFSTIWN